MNSSDKTAKHTKDGLKFLRSKHKTQKAAQFCVTNTRKTEAAAVAVAPGSLFYDLCTVNPEVLMEQFFFSAICFTILATAL